MRLLSETLEKKEPFIDDSMRGSYHLSLLASHSATNKMTLTNLRLILSPTLRLSPGFLLVLVEEREIIFGGVNQGKSAPAASV